MALSCKRPARWGPGANPTVDFLLHHLGVVVKKMGVKSLDWTDNGFKQSGKRLRIVCLTP
jgi:hypothetical protein